MPASTISALYCCYLLRSIPKPLSLYIGSSPDPIRRLKQHNGLRTGGAVRTSKDTQRPWEIVCTISGFPTKIAALQFEWAWQNAHITRKLRKKRMLRDEPLIATAARANNTFPKKRKSRLTAKQQIRNALLLTESLTFRRLPLRFGFYHEDVYRFWCQVESKHASNSNATATFPNYAKSDYLGPTPPSIGNGQLRLDVESRLSKGINSDTNELLGLSRTYNRHIPTLQFVEQTLLAREDTQCQTCTNYLDLREHTFTCCPNSTCHAFYHISCLAKAVLHTADTLGHEEQLIPLDRVCPACQTGIQWLDLTIGSSFIMANLSPKNQQTTKIPTQCIL